MMFEKDENIKIKYVLNFGEDRQEVPDGYILEPFQEWITEEEYLTKTYPNVGEANRKKYFDEIREKENVRFEFINNLDDKQLEKLKELLS